MAYSKENRRRYYLHQRLRERYTLNVMQRTIYVPGNELSKIPEPYNSLCNELGTKNGYVMQGTIK